MKKVILFNGPAGSGKDYAAKYVAHNYQGAIADKFARVLKERTHALYGMPWKAWDYYEDCKDIPNDDFYGITPRQAYISVSENHFKILHGKRIFGQILADELDNKDWDIVAISDSGFVEEGQVMVDKYGPDNVLLVRLHREGHDFTGDSRTHINLNVWNIDIINTGDDQFLQQIHDIVEAMLEGKLNLIGNPRSTMPNIGAQAKVRPMLSVTYNESAHWKDAVEAIEKGFRPPVEGDTYEKNPEKKAPDEDLTKRDYVFEDVVQPPGFFKRLRRSLTRGI